MDISALDDEAVWNGTLRLARGAREASADLLEYLAEFDHRALWRNGDYHSMFEFCVFKLGMAEGEAFKSIRAARAGRRYAPLLELLRAGEVSVAGMVLLHPHLDSPDAAELVWRARRMATRALEEMLAARLPAAIPARDSVRFVPPAPEPLSGRTLLSGDNSVHAKTDGGAGLFDEPAPENQAAPAEPAAPAEAGIRLAFSAGRPFYLRLCRAQALLRHKYPDGRLEGVLGDALQALLEKKDPGIRWVKRGRKRAAAAPP